MILIIINQIIGKNVYEAALQRPFSYLTVLEPDVFKRLIRVTFYSY